MLSRQVLPSRRWRLFALGLGAATLIGLSTPNTLAPLNETFTATNIVGTSTITTPAYVVNGGAVLPTIKACNGGPGVTTAPQGSLCIDSSTPALWQNQDGTNSWKAVGSGAATGTFWTPVASFDLSASPVTLVPDFSLRSGAWTKSGTPLVTVIDDGTTPAYMSYEQGGIINAPTVAGAFGNWQAMTWAAEVEFSPTAASPAGANAAITIYGNNGPIGTGAINARARFDGVDCGVERYNLSGTGHVCPFPAMSPGTWHKLHTEITRFDSGATGTAQIAIWFDGVLFWQGQVAVTTLFDPPRIGLWSNVGHAAFRNLKVWTMGPAT